MTVTRQEADSQLQALVKEIASAEASIAGWEERLDLAREREDQDEERFLVGEIAGGKRVIKVAKEQIASLTPLSSRGRGITR